MSLDDKELLKQLDLEMYNFIYDFLKVFGLENKMKVDITDKVIKLDLSDNLVNINIDPNYLNIKNYKLSNFYYYRQIDSEGFVNVNSSIKQLTGEGVKKVEYRKKYNCFYIYTLQGDGLMDTKDLANKNQKLVSNIFDLLHDYGITFLIYEYYMNILSRIGKNSIDTDKLPITKIYIKIVKNNLMFEGFLFLDLSVMHSDLNQKQSNS